MDDDDDALRQEMVRRERTSGDRDGDKDDGRREQE